MNLQIDPEFQSLIPPLSDDEKTQLESNIQADGCRDPLVVWKGVLIDGHNRYEICNRHDIPFSTSEKEFESRDDAKEWIIKHQFGRRNLPAVDRMGLAEELEIIYRARAKENQAVGHLNAPQYIENPVPQKSAELVKPIETRVEVSKAAGVSHDTYTKYKKIKAAAPQVIAEIRRGETTVNAVYNDLKKEQKKVERREVIETQMEQIEKGELPELQGKFEVISVDPPWPYGRKYDPDGSRVANPYPEMDIDSIKAIELPLSDNSIIFLWTTHQFLPKAFDILETWGATYKATLVWNKQTLGMGAWVRMQCEFCLVGIIGNPYWQNTTERDIISEPKRQHSRKPDAFFAMVEKITVGRRLEYFSREPRSGWEIYGNDTDKF